MPSEPRQAQALVQAKERNQPLQLVYSQRSVGDPARHSGETCTPITARMVPHRPAQVNALTRRRGVTRKGWDALADVGQASCLRRASLLMRGRRRVCGTETPRFAPCAAVSAAPEIHAPLAHAAVAR